MVPHSEARRTVLPSNTLAMLHEAGCLTPVTLSRENSLPSNESTAKAEFANELGGRFASVVGLLLLYSPTLHGLNNNKQKSTFFKVLMFGSPIEEVITAIKTDFAIVTV